MTLGTAAVSMTETPEYELDLSFATDAYSIHVSDSLARAEEYARERACFQVETYFIWHDGTTTTAVTVFVSARASARKDFYRLLLKFSDPAFMKHRDQLVKDLCHLLSVADWVVPESENRVDQADAFELLVTRTA